MKPPCRVAEYLAALRQALRARPALVERILGEVEDHLWEGVACEQMAGASREEAERRAIERFGPVEEVARWWSEVYTRENGDAPMWQRFTERARKVVYFAQEEAARFGHNFVGTEHLLLGLVREEDSLAGRILTGRLGISLSSIRSNVEKQVTRGPGCKGQEMALTPRAQRTIDLCYEESRRLNNNYIGTEHLLLGLIMEPDGLGGRVLRELGADLARTRAEVTAMHEQGEAHKVERAMLVSRVQSGFYGALARVVPLSPEARALIRVLTTTDPGQLAEAAASYLMLAEADRQALAPEKPAEERLQKLIALLQGEVAFQFPAGEPGA
jgi:hypothetical protein